MKSLVGRYPSSLVLGLLLIMYAVGVFGHLNSFFYPVMLVLTPWILLSFALVTLVQTVKSADRSPLQKKRIIIWVMLTWLATYLLEVAGVHTGKVFGSYSYGQTLGPMLFQVPVIIGLNWVIIVFGIAESLRTARVSLLLSLVLVPAGAVFFDLFLEPVAMSQLDYWSWGGPVVPLQNYIAWAVISFVFAVLYFLMVPYPSLEKAGEAGEAGAKEAQKPAVERMVARFFPGLYVILQFLFIFALNRLLPWIG